MAAVHSVHQTILRAKDPHQPLPVFGKNNRGGNSAASRLRQDADKSNDIRYGLVDRCRETDQPIAALVKDLKQRGLFDETLIVWGGEFGRTPMNEERNGSTWLGRDHNQHAFTIWMAGGGVKRGISYGATDDLGYHSVENRMHVHDLQATILHAMGLDHTRLSYRFQGRDFRLTDVHGNVVKELLA